jgi:Icc-related predicted phosphoesterase
MRLLAFSDIHHNLVAVRKLRASEKNSFDAIVVAGDIGSESAIDFFKILTTFKCPVLYVYGNWDHKLDYNASFGHNCHLVHSNVRMIGNLYFTGFSGCPTHWGKNPIARRLHRELRQAHKPILEALSRAESLCSKQTKVVGIEKARKPIEKIKRTKAFQKYASQMKLSKSETLRLNRESVGKAVREAGIDPRRCIVVTHERLARLREELPGTLLHLFGHIHQFSDHNFKGTKYIDVAALDRPISVRPLTRERSAGDRFRNLNAGNYATIEINSSLEIRATCMPLQHDYLDLT